MAPRQTALGHCLTVPLSPGQEMEEKVFFRRNTEMLCQLFQSRSCNSSENRFRRMNEFGSTRCFSSSSHVIKIPSARFGSNSRAPNDVIRPHTTSPISLAKTFQQKWRPLINFRGSATTPERKKENEDEDDNNITDIISSLPARKQSGSASDQPLFDLLVCGNDSHNGDDDKDSDNDNDDSLAVSSRHAKLLASHRHPPSIHCDTLGPMSCRYCNRRMSMSDASFMLPDSGIISTSKGTVRLPPPRSHQETFPALSTNVKPSRSPVTVLQPYTPLSVFLRARRNKRDDIETSKADKHAGLYSEVIGNKNDELVVMGYSGSSNENKAYKESCDDNDDYDDDNDDDDDDNAAMPETENKGNNSDVKEGTGFDGLRVKVTFRLKSPEK